MAATPGFLTYLVLGSEYWSAGCAMVITIVLMILLDGVHPPVVATLIDNFRQL